jgi:hypothetical protein
MCLQSGRRYTSTNRTIASIQVTHLSEPTDKIGFDELDSHTDTACVGLDCHIIHDGIGMSGDAISP